VRDKNRRPIYVFNNKSQGNSKMREWNKLMFFCVVVIVAVEDGSVVWEEKFF